VIVVMAVMPMAMIVMVVVTVIVVVTVMVMMMLMTVVIVVVMGVIMMVVIVAMIMVMMIMAGADISASFRIERRFDLEHAAAKAFHHVLDDVVAADTQVPASDLHRQVPIAEMPGDANKMQRIGPDFDQRLGGGNDLDQPVVVEHQRITAAQRHRLRQVEQEFETARAGHRQPPAMAVVEFQHDSVGRRVAPASCSLDRCRSQHPLSASRHWPV
jgi:hypothetical protein